MCWLFFLAMIIGHLNVLPVAIFPYCVGSDLKEGSMLEELCFIQHAIFANMDV